MSHIFGKIIQTAYVVRDIEAAMRHWTGLMGVGPWFYREKAPLETFTYGGRPSGLEMSIALGYDGDMQFELIQQRNDAPSVYRDFLETFGEGQQHLGFRVDDLDAAIEKGAALGYTVTQEGFIANSGPFAYMGAGGHPGAMIEFLPMPELRRRSWEIIKGWARGWDGSDPIRTEVV